jgi:hypothetical protein
MASGVSAFPSHNVSRALAGIIQSPGRDPDGPPPSERQSGEEKMPLTAVKIVRRIVRPVEGVFIHPFLLPGVIVGCTAQFSLSSTQSIHVHVSSKVTNSGIPLPEQTCQWSTRGDAWSEWQRVWNLRCA